MRRIIVHRPLTELRRLTPASKAELFLDDVVLGRAPEPRLIGTSARLGAKRALGQGVEAPPASPGLPTLLCGVPATTRSDGESAGTFCDRDTAIVGSPRT